MPIFYGLQPKKFVICLYFITLDFWLERETVYEQPVVKATGRMVIEALGTSNLMWSTQSTFMTEYQSSVVSTTVQSVHEDTDYDGLTDYIRINVTMIHSSTAVSPIIQTVTGLIELVVQLTDEVKSTVYTVPIVTGSSYTAVSTMYMLTTLAIQQDITLKTGTSSGNNVDSVLDDSSIGYDMQSIEEAELENSIRYQLVQVAPPTFTTANSTDFQLELVIKVPKAMSFTRMPSVWDMYKHAWGKYLAMLIPTYIVLKWVQRVILSRRWLATRMVCPPAQSLTSKTL